MLFGYPGSSCLLAKTLPGSLSALNLGNEDTVATGFYTNRTRILKFYSGPLPTTHRDLYQGQISGARADQENPTLKDRVQALSSPELKKRSLASCPHRTFFAQKTNFLIPVGMGTSKSLQSLPGSFYHSLPNLYP